MISTDRLAARANELIALGLTRTQVTQLTAIKKFSENSKYVVATVADLPDAATNEGRIIYVTAEQDFYFSRGVDWTTVFDTTIGSLFVNEVRAWGINTSGELGDGTAIDRSSPVTVTGSIINWNQIDTGDSSHIIGISNNIIYTWGNNLNGQLGDGTVIAKSSPVTVIGGITNWSSVSAGYLHSLGIANGIAYAWGNNTHGRLGDGTGIAKSSPVTVVGGINNWSQVSAGDSHSLGIANGIAYAWGRADQGQLGNNVGGISRSSPVTVVGGITNWSQVSAGIGFSLGITNGIVYAWGLNLNGRLGDNTVITKSSPVTVVGGITNWSSISAGGSHSLAIRNGVAYAWGASAVGKLGDGTVIDRSSPVTVIGGITNWSQVSAGNAHSLGIANGIAYAWGENNNGRLGDGTIIDKSSPITVIGGITNWSQVSARFRHSMATYTLEKGF